MKTLLMWLVVLAAVPLFAGPATAEVNVNIGISLPPPILFPQPPEVIVIPDAPDVYVVPDVEADLFFWGGFWWRLWDGRWYRSRYYDRGWGYYSYVPEFYFGVDPGWRRYYYDRNWYGHRWNYERIPAPRLQRNWRSWHNNRYWERRRSYGVQNYRPMPVERRQELRREREMRYRERPDVQRHQRPAPAPERAPRAVEPRPAIEHGREHRPPPEAQPPRGREVRPNEVPRPVGPPGRVERPEAAPGPGGVPGRIERPEAAPRPNRGEGHVPGAGEGHGRGERREVPGAPGEFRGERGEGEGHGRGR